MCIICTEMIKAKMNIQDVVKAGMELIRSNQITEEHLEEIVQEIIEKMELEDEEKWNAWNFRKTF